MVFEALLRAQKAEKRPFLVFLLGILYSSIAVIFGLFAFRRDESILVISFIVFAAIPLMYMVIRLEEKKDRYVKKESVLLREHSKALFSFVALFLGILISLSLWYVFLPYGYVKELFSSQIREVMIVEQGFSGTVVRPGLFSFVILHNLQVLFFSFLFSFFFGAGAIYILTWNASVIAVALGSFIREQMVSFSESLGVTTLGAYFGSFSYGLLGYMSHGIFEMIAYFIAGIAGGIISVAVIRHDLFNKKFRKIIYDSLLLMGISVIVLLLGAFIESHISSLIF